MRKFICLALIAFLVTGIAGCGYRITRVETSEPMRESPGRAVSSENEQTVSASPFEQDLISKSIALTNKMIANAADPSLLDGFSDPQLLRMLASFAELKDTVPDIAIVLSFSDSAVDEMMVSFIDDRGISLSASEESAFREIALAIISASFVHSYGDYYFAASTVVQEEDSYSICEDPDFTSNAYVILIYDISSDGIVSMVSFRPSGEKTMIGEARFSVHLYNLLDWDIVDELLSRKSDKYLADEFTTDAIGDFIAVMMEQEIIEDVFAGSFRVTSYQGVQCSVYDKEQVRQFGS